MKYKSLCQNRCRHCFSTSVGKNLFATKSVLTIKAKANWTLYNEWKVYHFERNIYIDALEALKQKNIYIYSDILLIFNIFETDRFVLCKKKSPIKLKARNLLSFIMEKNNFVSYFKHGSDLFLDAWPVFLRLDCFWLKCSIFYGVQ